MKDYEKLSREHFNKQAPVYDQNDTVYYSKEGKMSCRDISVLLKNNQYSSLLDVGCGTGYLAELLAKDHNGVYCGLDLSEEMIRIAEKKGIHNTEFTVGKCDRLPWPDRHFDIVTCSQSFHHYPDPEKAMKEAYRVLKSGGLYILSDTGVGGIGGWIDNHIIFKIMKSGDCHTTDRHGIEEMMKKTGFSVIDSYQVKGFVYTVIGGKEMPL